MHNKLPFFILPIIALIVVLGSAFSKDNALFNASASSTPLDPNLISEEIKIYRFFQNDTPLEGALLSIPLNQDLDNPVIFSATLDLNKDGKFKNIERGVDEIPAGVEDSLPNNFPLIFKNKHQIEQIFELDEGDTVNVNLVLIDRNTTPLSTKEKKVRALIINWDVGEFFEPGEGLYGGIGDYIEDSLETDNINFVGNVYAADPKVPVSNKDVPDLNPQKGKPNQCVPISLANSLRWLGKKHAFNDKLPASDNDLIDQLAEAVKWNKDGTKGENVLPGKNKYTEDKKLPLTNKRIDNKVVEGKSMLWEDIVKELNDGEDVELLFDFKQSPKGKAEKGHAVTVVGADKDKKDKESLTFHDSVTPEGNDTYVVDRNGQILGYPLGKSYVSFIISESFKEPSPTPTITPSLSPTTTPTPIPSPSVTPTDVPRPSATPSITLTVSPSPTITPSISPTHTTNPTSTPST